MIEEPRCSVRHCRHLRAAFQLSDEEPGEVPCCAAFPEGIPRQIAYGNNLHLEPFPGDHGIQYERDPEAAEDEDWWDGEPVAAVSTGTSLRRQ